MVLGTPSVKSKSNTLTLIGILVFIAIFGISSIKKSSAPISLPQPEQGPTTAELRQVAQDKVIADKEWDASAAGKLCAKHPDWQRLECNNLADNQVWIGMSYEQLVYLRGKPESTKASNYGRGNTYQYCWTTMRPACFYDRNDDGILDAYN
jgi:hypothetical protein